MAAKKKDFSSIDTANVFDQIRSAVTPAAPETQNTSDADYAPDVAAASDGKPMRVNLAITPDNALFVRTMARVSGLTVTDFLNRLIENSVKDYAEEFEQAKKFLALFPEKRSRK